MCRLSRREFVRGAGAGAAGALATAGCLRSAGQDGGPAGSSTDGVSFSVQHAWGPDSQREVQWDDGGLTVTCGDEDPDSDASRSEGVVGADVTLGTTQRIDMSPVSRVLYVYRHRSTPGNGVDRSEAAEDVSYFAISRALSELSEKQVRYDDDPNEPDNPDIAVSMYLKNREDTDRTEREIDVSDLSDPAFLGVGANVGASLPQVVTLEMFDVRGVDESGEEVFRLDAANEALSFG